jgi:hypothetical protein
MKRPLALLLFLLAPVTLAAEHRRVVGWVPPQAPPFVIGAEERLPQPEVIGRTSGSYETRVVAGNGQELVLWRNGAGVQGARISRGGALLDAVPFDLPAGAGGAAAEGVWDGSRFVVFSTGYLDNDSRMSMTRIERDGTLTSTRILDPLPTLPGWVAAATDGSRVLVVTSETGGMAVRLLDRDGKLLRATNVDTPNTAFLAPRIAAGAGGYLVVWDAITTTAVPVSSDGFVGTPRFVLAANDPDVTWSGRDFLVVGSTSDSVRAVHVSADGNAGAPFVARVSRYGSARNAAVAWNGAESMIAWEELSAPPETPVPPYDLLSIRLRDDGTMTEPVTLARSIDYRTRYPANAGGADVAADGATFVLGWAAQASAAPFINTVVRATTTESQEAAVLTNGTRSQSAPLLATGGGATIELWSESEDLSQTKFWLYRLLGSEKVNTLTSGGADAAVAWNGSDFVVVWTEGGNVVAARIAKDGTGIDAEPVAVASERATDLHVACRTTDCIVAWAHIEVGTAATRAQRFAPSLAKLDGVLDLGRYEGSFSIAADDAGYLALRSQYLASSIYTYGLRIRDGAVSGLFSFAGTSAGKAVWSGEKWLILLGLRTAQGSGLHALLMTPEGAFFDMRYLGAAAFAQHLVWDGKNFVAAILPYDGAPRLVRIGPNAELRDGFLGYVGVPLGMPQAFIRSMAADTNGRITLGYSERRSDAPYLGWPGGAVRVVEDP